MKVNLEKNAERYGRSRNVLSKVSFEGLGVTRGVTPASDPGEHEFLHLYSRFEKNMIAP